MDGRDAVCEACGRVGSSAAGRCAACGSTSLARTADGFVVGFTAGMRRCPECGTAERPLELRGWVRLTSVLVWQRERRHAAYVCHACARRETARCLFYTAAFGWWSVFALLFLAPRATFHNWRAAYTYPRAPRRWGAQPATELLVPALRRSYSPLRQLVPSERDLVVGADALYERLGARPDADVEEIRRAFRARAKRVHPDTGRQDPSATEQMMLLNQAWEILSSSRLRAAYDWLERERVG
jgi:hypothetical protein